MNPLEQQARSFFLRCRATPWQPRRVCIGGVRRQISQTTHTRASTQHTSHDLSSSPTEPTKPYYVTTPIYYVNAEPHVGHLYSLVLADVLKRWHDLKSPGSTLLTGTDEHGMKVQKAAEKADTDTSVFCAMNARKFKSLANKANIAYNRFIRTTDDDHKSAVETFFLQLQNKGYIYQAKHEGWYCVSDETFYPESQIHMIIEPQTGRKIYASKETGKEVQWTSEENYHFRLSDFRERLLKHYQDNPNFVVPTQRLNFIISEVESGLTDLSVSRPSSRLQWGVRVPGDNSQTIYVWLDALINYITMAGYPFVPRNPIETIWPPDCQVIGKDIIRFHCIYWPAFLMALDLPLPKQFLSHAHWTMNEEKMSKSLGNVVNPFHAMDRFGVDTMRYYMVRDGGYADDSSYENSFIIARYKKELQGTLGNSLSRLLNSKKWNIRECIDHMRPQLNLKPRKDLPEPWSLYIKKLYETTHSANEYMKSSDPRSALSRIMQVVIQVNQYIQEKEPWRLAESPRPEDQELLKEVIYYGVDHMRVVAILLQPFMPEKMKMALDMLGVRDEARDWGRRGMGKDFDYGIPKTDGGEVATSKSILFPPLSSSF